MSSQREKASLFHSLHVRGAPLVLCNVWDAGSANAVTAAGARAGEVADTVRSLLEVGAVGCNIEDRLPENGPLRARILSSFASSATVRSYQ